MAAHKKGINKAPKPLSQKVLHATTITSLKEVSQNLLTIKKWLLTNSIDSDRYEIAVSIIAKFDSDLLKAIAQIDEILKPGPGKD